VKVDGTVKSSGKVRKRPKINTHEESPMKYRKAALFLIVPALFFLFACAHVSSSGSQTAVLHVPECLE
jgi:hypothetical protein